ncbi:MAG: TadE family protein [Planctomycetota bacterium]
MRVFLRGEGSNPNRHRGRAAAIVEFAVVLPLLLTILLGIIEYGWVFMVRQTLQNAAREGCRLLVLQTSVEPYANVTTRIGEVMAPTGISAFSSNMVHNECEETVSVTVPYGNVSLVGGFFGTADYDLTGSCTMRKEGCVEGG